LNLRGGRINIRRNIGTTTPSIDDSLNKKYGSIDIDFNKSIFLQNRKDRLAKKFGRKVENLDDACKPWDMG